MLVNELFDSPTQSKITHDNAEIPQPDIEDQASKLLPQVPSSYNPYVEINSGSGKLI
jgi:hypothetical protein